MNLNNNVSISVVISTCDRPLRFLKSAIESALCQSLPPYEVIVVDNSSEYVDPDSMPEGIRLLRLPPKVGPSKARNSGAEAARGDFVSFLDDDDLWHRDYLYEVSKSINNLSADVVLARLVRVDTHAKCQPYKLFPNNTIHQRRIFYSNPGFGGQNLTIRRDIFLAHHGFDTKMPSSEDRDLGARLLSAGVRIVSSPNALAIIRHHAGPRARHNQAYGNYIFICNHWRHMRFPELLRALHVLLRRTLFLMLNRS